MKFIATKRKTFHFFRLLFRSQISRLSRSDYSLHVARDYHSVWPR